MKTINVLLVTLFCVTNVLFAQEEEIYFGIPPGEDMYRDTTNNLFIIVEEMPEYPGGDEARIRFLADNVVYPDSAKEKVIQGMVYVSFVVEQDGSVSDVKVVRGIGGGCDEEVVRVVKLMPKWKPGKQSGEPVRVQFTMPVKFTL